jgi:hypothetical protein
MTEVKLSFNLGKHPTDVFGGDHRYDRCGHDQAQQTKQKYDSDGGRRNWKVDFSGTGDKVGHWVLLIDANDPVNALIDAMAVKCITL